MRPEPRPVPELLQEPGRRADHAAVPASQVREPPPEPPPELEPPPWVEASRETVRVDLAPARARERGAAVRWTSTTEVVRIDSPASSPVVRPERVVLTVTQLTQAVKGVLAEGFRRVMVRGEVSNFRGLHASGHLFFKLKDAGASIDVKIWASVVQRLRFRLEEGMEVVAEGNLDVYEKAGQYNLIVQRIEPSGAGALAIAFAQLRDRLTAEGLMGENRLRPPRPLPFLPRHIGVVTSRSGAALHDFLRVLHRRNSRLSVLLCRRPGAGTRRGGRGGARPPAARAHRRGRHRRHPRRRQRRGPLDVQRGDGGTGHRREPGTGGLGGGARGGLHHRGLRRRRARPHPERRGRAPRA